MEICGRKFSAEVLVRIREMSEADPGVSRRALSLKVCDLLDWKDAKGRLREMSCRVALLKLDRMGQIKLPEPASPAPSICKRDAQAPDISKIQPVECGLAELGQIELICVRGGTEESRIWNELMDAYHYLGRGPLCGAQIRYLIRNSGHGWLGGFAFSAAAWRLAPRDRWIGWTDSEREKNLDKVVCNSRFLILPGIKVANLASHVLGLAAARLAGDWMDRYGISPVLLETFVEQGRFQGSSYRAANWRHIGHTRGRGRQDRNRLNVLPIKDIYIYPLCGDAREILCSQPADSPPKVVCPAKPPQDWAEEEFAGVDLGDGRLTKRLVTIARDFYARPQANIPQACQSRAKTKAAYRFFENPNTEMEKVLAQHFETTVQRAAKHPVVLAVQDTTSLNYSTHPATENLGPISTSKDGVIGLLVHDTVAFDLEGTPLGLLDVQCWARDPKGFGKKKLRYELPIEQKESFKWLHSYRRVAEAQKKCRETTFVCVGDREADIYELFKLALKDSEGPRLLVRAVQNRRLSAEQGHIWDRMEREPVSGIQEIHIPRARNRAARVAKLDIRFARLVLKPPKRKSELGEVEIWGVSAREQSLIEGIEPVEWMLLTTSEVNSFEQAVEVLAWYTGRWGIEVYHRTLKSGCKIEERQLGAADRIEACLAIDMVVAWRIFHLAKLGREVPNVPCTIFFEEAEWKALVAYITQNPNPPVHPPTLREAIRMVATLGGFLGRKCDGEPGTKSLWLGLQRLDDMTFMYKVLVPHLLHPLVSSNPGYG